MELELIEKIDPEVAASMKKELFMRFASWLGGAVNRW